jgi:predicted unusual protein kinase regulating ubiquinone biosynthesis (AarF/ABC1/UbiB family)
MTPSRDKSLPQGRIRRTMPLAGFTARAAGGRLVAGLREKSGSAGAVDRFHERTAEQYAELLGHSKGVLMKAGQIFSMVDTNFGTGELSPYQKALARLQADAPPMDPGLVNQVLEADLGRPAKQVFAEFTRQPMAAASIGQVHRAVLHNGRQVAVKIQYPGAARAIRDDLANTELLTTFFRFIVSASGNTPQPDLRPVTQEIAARIFEEIDYRHEAANITRFSNLYGGHPFIRVPEVIDEASGDRVLTMTYLDGMDWSSAQQASQELKNTWAEAIWRFTMGSYRHGNLFNADPQPGNYRFGSDGTVGFVDFGCIKILPEHRRRLFVEMLRASFEGRKDDLHRLMIEVGFMASDLTLTPDEAYQWMEEITYEAHAPQPVTFNGDSSQRAIHAMLDARSPEHPMRRVSLPSDLIFFSRINFGVNMICASLRACIHVRALLDDQDGVAAPITSLGKQHDAWVRDRGLPYGLQHHDDP